MAVTQGQITTVTSLFLFVFAMTMINKNSMGNLDLNALLCFVSVLSGLSLFLSKLFPSELFYLGTSSALIAMGRAQPKLLP